ncbi:MAG: hypothetical protein DPW18_15520 [Chloroflexi bacterium]|nr:hypothetical protein [Chloroflexota bacterium]MDL1944020.1 hypothetical protein [Chloroflexi bacterium CFX2]
MIIFQGNVVRAYVTPYDPKSPAQVAVRDVFRDITKTEKQAGLWVKNAMRTVFGSRWYTGLYKRVTENGNQRLGLALDDWNAFTPGQQDDWDSNAPHSTETLRPGFAFFVVMWCIREWLTVSNAPLYGMDPLSGGNAALANEWYAKSLAGVVTSGTIDDDDVMLGYIGQWSDVGDAAAYGGTYKESGVTETPTCEFYFYGTQLSLRFVKKPNAGMLEVSSYAFGTEVIGQNASQILQAQTWSSRRVIRGLHYVTLRRTGTGAVNLDSVTVSNKTVVSAISQAVQEVSEVPSVCLTLGQAWSVPGAGPHVIYWDKELWDTGGMHDAPIPPYQVRALVSGRYDMYCEVVFQNTNETWTGELFVYVNSQIVAYDTARVFVGTPSSMRLQVGRRIDLNVGDLVMVYLKNNRIVSTPINIQPNYTPLFQLELSQRTSLMVETINVTQQVGTSDHGEMTGLGDDDHLQYFNQVRGDARYAFAVDFNNLVTEVGGKMDAFNWDILSIGVTVTIPNDGVVLIDLPSTAGLFMFLVQMRSGSTATNWIVGSCKAAATSVCESYIKGSDVEVFTGELLGTGGTVGKMAVSVHVDGKFYIRNRTGQQRNFTYKIW